jgi:multidrug efflux pump
MKSFTDLFIRRPVLATVVSLLILVVGVRAGLSLAVLQFPKTTSSTITISTIYYGADPDVVAGFITQPLENAIAQANGIDYLQSKSASGISTITAYLRLNYDSNKALNEINIKINGVLNQLPPGSQQPLIQLSVGSTFDPLFLGFSSSVLSPTQLNDYVVREVQPRLQAIEGVQTAELLGQQNFALRAWLDPKKLAGFGLTASDVYTALAANDYVSGLGTTRGQMVQVNLTASTDIHSQDEFRNLIIKQQNGAIIRLRDVATVTLGSDNYDVKVAFDHTEGIFLGIQTVPGANVLKAVGAVKAAFPDIQARLPQGVNALVVYDASQFVTSSIREVIITLVEALAIVTLVVFLFLGSVRSVLIPVIAIPVSLIGTFAMMAAFGFTINLLTLLALVLAIGLVVDDAIIVVENVNRHLSEGMSPLPASLLAARELAAPIIAMTVVLIAVYVPIGLQSGLTGALFSEFAFTVVGAVTISAVVALTLSPMMSSRLLKPRHPDSRGWQDRLTALIDRNFDRFRGRYERNLANTLDTLPVVLIFAGIVLGSIYFLYKGSSSELAPPEDQGAVIAFGQPPPNATVQQDLLWSNEVLKTYESVPEAEHFFQFVTPDEVFGGMILKPWNQRHRSAATLNTLTQQKLGANVAGMQMQIFSPPSLPGSNGLPISVVIKTTQPFAQLSDVSDAMLQAAIKSGDFIFLINDLKIDQPQSRVVIDRDKASVLGLSMADIGGAMSRMLGGGYVNYFSLSGRSYKVIPQVQQVSRLNADQLLNYYIGNVGGVPVPLSAVARITTQTVPESLNRFQQQNAATLSGAPAPGVTTATAVKTLQDIAARVLPAGYTLDYAGTSRQEVQESSGFLATFGLALIIIFLALAALFESFRDPLIILVSVPMSIAGALIFINIGTLGIGTVSLNIYTEVGLVTLMGLISKHGILIVEVANEAQAAGMTRRAAILHAAGIRLRPILMTTAAMVLGVMPLVFSSGAGAASRFNMGVVIATGLAIGTLFTLFVVPAVYLLIAGDHQRGLEQQG